MISAVNVIMVWVLNKKIFLSFLQHLEAQCQWLKSMVSKRLNTSH